MRRCRSAMLVLAVVVMAAGCAGHRPDRAAVVDLEARLRHGAPPEAPKVPNPWFMQQRSGPTGVMPPDARARAVARLLADGAVDEGTATWTPAGPTNVGGRVSALAVDPNDSQRIWLGAAEGGVFLSEDGGTSWVPVFDDQTALSIGSLAVHPLDSDVVFAGTGEETGGGYSYDGEGVFRTTDGGSTWVQVGLVEGRRIAALAVDPVDGSRVFAAVAGGLHHHDIHRGIYRSTDGGDTWVPVLYVQDDAGGVDVTIDPTDRDRIYAAIWQRSRAGNVTYFGGAASGVYRSTDGGDTWTLLSGGLPTGPDTGRIGLAVAPSSPQRVYASVVRSSGVLNGIYRSNDGGDTWARVSSASLPGSFSPFGYYFGRIRVDPVDPDSVYVLDINLWQSTNGGVSFGVIGSEMHVDHHAIEIGPGTRLLVGNDGGFYRRLFGGSGFAHNTDLAISQFYDLCIDPSDANRRFGGTQDNGTLRTTSGGVSNWAKVLGGDGMHCVVDPVDGDRVYAESQWGNLHRSTNGGASFTLATSGISGSDRKNWVTPITHDPLATGVLYTGTQRVYRSTNGALSWSAISGDLSDGPPHAPATGSGAAGRGYDHGQDPIQGTVTAIAVSPLDTDILWAGTDDGNMWVSDDGGSNWTQVDPPGSTYWVTEIAPDPYSAGGAYATFAGYRSDDTLAYVRYTGDLGQTWQDLGATLPQLPLNSVAADPAWRGRVFVAGDLGVHLSDDGGVSWVLLGGGIPYVVVLDLVLDAGSRTLFAGTHGRSMFALDLDLLPAADGDGDGVDNNADCALADPGAFAPPGEVRGLKVSRGPAGEAVLTWDGLGASAGPDTAYDVALGSLSSLPASGTGAAVDLLCGSAASSAEDPAPVTPGEGTFYVVRGLNVCGAGPWGPDGEGSERVVGACP